MRQLAIVSTARQAEQLAEIRASRAEMTLYASSSSAYCTLRAQGVAFKGPLDYISYHDYEGLDQRAGELARNWHQLAGVAEMLTYHGIPLGLLGQQALHNMLAELLRSVVTIDAVLRAERPSEVILGREALRLEALSWASSSLNFEWEAALLLTERSGIPVTWLPVSEPSAISPRVGSRLLTRARRLLASKWRRLLRRVVLLWALPSLLAERVGEAASLRRRPGRLRLLAFARTYQLANLTPVLAALRSDPEVRLVVLGDLMSPAILSRLARKGIVCRKWDAWLEEATEGELRRAIKSCQAWWAKAREDMRLHRHFTVEGLPLWPIVRPLLDRVVEAQILPGIRRVAAYKRALDTLRPDGILLMADTDMLELALVLAAQARKIPTVVVQHGVLVSPSNYDFNADRMAVWGELPKEWFIQTGKSPERLIITGYPLFDRYRALPPPTTAARARLRKRLGLPGGARVALLVTNQSGGVGRLLQPGEGAELFEAIFQTFADHLPDLVLIVRQHPAEDRGIPQRLAARFRLTVALNPEAELAELIDLADVIISQYTTAGLEAIIKGKPVVYLNLFCVPDLVPFAKVGAAIGVYAPEELAPAVRAALEDPTVRQELAAGRQRLLREYLSDLDGRATERVVALVKGIAEEARRCR